MKTIYFVRHGESEGNVGEIGNLESTPLTEKGREQAAYLAARCSSLPIETIVSSTMMRARETADIINTKLNKSLEHSDLFRENRHPTETVGKPKEDEAVKSIRMKIIDMFHEPGFRFSDEENFEDLRERAKKALEHLAARPENNILVVTHGLFLRILAAYLVMGDKLTAGECRQFMRTMGTENTGLFIFHYDPSVEWRPWKIWIWNDHAHLG